MVIPPVQHRGFPGTFSQTQHRSWHTAPVAVVSIFACSSQLVLLLSQNNIYMQCVGVFLGGNITQSSKPGDSQSRLFLWRYNALFSLGTLLGPCNVRCSVPAFGQPRLDKNINQLFVGRMIDSRQEQGFKSWDACFLGPTSPVFHPYGSFLVSAGMLSPCSRALPWCLDTLPSHVFFSQTLAF